MDGKAAAQVNLQMYVGRMAPSPTGLLHLGHARTFAVAHRRARLHGGEIGLRVDDLDPARSRVEYVGALMEDLRWLGLGWNGEPVFQSARGGAYRAAWEALVRDGWVYPCGCSRRDLAAAAGAPHEGEDEAVYPGTCRPARLPEAAERERWLEAGPGGVNWRFRAPSGEAVAWVDGGEGPQQFVCGREVGDFGVWRRDGVAAYQLACVVDDRAMGVTEVVRGADLLLSTARQILVYRALGLDAPGWFHCPLVRDGRGERLAKRTDALSVRALREQGWGAEAVLARAFGA